MSSAASSISSVKEQPVNETIKPVNEYEDAERNYRPKSLKFWTILIGIYLSIFLVALDRTIIATAIPRITDEFHSLQDIGWYGSAYMLTAACFQPISGRIFRLYSIKWSFLASIVVFEVGSALCGAAPNSIAFILGRAIAGVGSAGIFSGGIMVIVPLVPLRKRPVFTSFFGLAFGVASVLGPIIGGSLTDHVSWRWCFYINLPIGAFTILATILFLHIETPQQKKLTVFEQVKQLDPLGILFLVPSMVCLILALEWGGTSYPWSAPKIIGLLVTFAVLFTAFVVVEVLLPETAMAPMRVVLNRSVAGSMAFMFLLSGGLMSIIYYLTVWFQVAKGDSATRAGVSTLPLILSLVVAGVASGAITQKLGYYVPAMLASPVLCSIGSGLLITLIPSTRSGAWVGFQLLYGFGIGCGFQNSNLVAQIVLPRADVPLGLALMFFMQQLGGAFFVALSQTIFSTKLVSSLSGIAGLDAAAILHSTGATAIRALVPADDFQMVIDRYSYALTRVFILSTIVSACTLFGALALKWTKIPQKDAESAHRSGSSDAEIETVKNETKSHV